MKKLKVRKGHNKRPCYFILYLSKCHHSHNLPAKLQLCLTQTIHAHTHTQPIPIPIPNPYPTISADFSALPEPVTVLYIPTYLGGLTGFSSSRGRRLYTLSWAAILRPLPPPTPRLRLPPGRPRPSRCRPRRHQGAALLGNSATRGGAAPPLFRPFFGGRRPPGGRDASRGCASALGGAEANKAAGGR